MFSSQLITSSGGKIELYLSNFHINFVTRHTSGHQHTLIFNIIIIEHFVFCTKIIHVMHVILKRY